MHEMMRDTFWSADQMKTNTDFQSRINLAKGLILFFHVNPLIVGLLAIVDYMVPDWWFQRSDSLYFRALYLAIFLITLAGSYLIIYVHVFSYFYYCLHVNIPTDVSVGEIFWRYWRTWFGRLFRRKKEMSAYDTRETFSGDKASRQNNEVHILIERCVSIKNSIGSVQNLTD